MQDRQICHTSPRLAFAQRLVAGLQDRFQEVAQHRLLVGQDLGCRRIAGADEERFLVRTKKVLVGTQTHSEETLLLAGILIFDGVRADEFDGRLKPAIDAEVISVELHHRRLPDMNEGDVGGLHLGLDQQGVLHRDDFHQILARLDDSANRADLDLLDGAAHGRADLGPGDLVLVRLQLFGHAGQLDPLFAQLGRRIGAEGYIALLNAVLCLRQGGLGLRQLKLAALEFGLEIVDLALLLQLVDLRHHALPHGVHDVQLLLRQRQRFLEVVDLVGELLDFPVLLGCLVAQDRLLRVELIVTDLGVPPLVVGQIRRFLQKIGGKHDLVGRLPGYLGLESRYGGGPEQIALVQVVVVGLRRGVVDADQDLVLVDDVAFLDEDSGHDAALEILDDLDLARRDDLALAARHDVEDGVVGPDEERNDDDADGDHQQMAEDPEALAVGVDRVDPIVAVVCRGGHCGAPYALTAVMRPFMRASSTVALGPSATTLPPSMTIRRSTSESIEWRWVTSNSVLPGRIPASWFLNAASVLLSIELVGSSIT